MEQRSTGQSPYTTEQIGLLKVSFFLLKIFAIFAKTKYTTNAPKCPDVICRTTEARVKINISATEDI